GAAAECRRDAAENGRVWHRHPAAVPAVRGPHFTGALAAGRILLALVCLRPPPTSYVGDDSGPPFERGVPGLPRHQPGEALSGKILDGGAALELVCRRGGGCVVLALSAHGYDCLTVDQPLARQSGDVRGGV